jgi:hypothetical protein
MTLAEREKEFQRGEATLTQRVDQVMRGAGFARGHFHQGSGWSDDALEYRPAVVGYVVGLSYLGQLYVDHAGRGRERMIPLYQAALEAAGIVSMVDGIDCWQTWTRLVPGRKKRVVWTELWDERFEARRRQHRESAAREDLWILSRDGGVVVDDEP